MSRAAIEGRVDVREVDAFSRTLGQYERISSRSEDEILNRKGNDLRIQIGRLYRGHRWKGGKSVAAREARKRFKAGRGIKVRLKYLESEYEKKAPPFLKTRNRSRRTGSSSRLRKLSFWQKLVFQEIARRQAGIGVLGASFFPKRRRFRQAGGARKSFLVENKSRQLGPLIKLEKGKGFFRISGFAPGLGVVDRRHSIATKAVRRVREDTERYIERKAINDLRRFVRRAS